MSSVSTPPSPMGAGGAGFLGKPQPDIVLIEGLDDATDLLPDVVRKETKPPIAILASIPTRYPSARWSIPSHVTVRNIRRSVGRTRTAFSWSSAIYHPPSFSGYRTSNSKGWKRSGARQVSRIRPAPSHRSRWALPNLEIRCISRSLILPTNGITILNGNATSNTNRLPIAITGAASELGQSSA